MRPDVLSVLEAYFDTVPRAVAEAHEVGPFTVFVSRSAWPYYARPRLGLSDTIDVEDVRRVLAWQAGRGQPGALEWVTQTTPSLASAAAAAGLDVASHPLLVLSGPVQVPGVDGVTVRTLGAEDPDLAAVRATLDASFAHGGTARGEPGAAARDAALADLDPAGLDRLREMIGRDELVMVGAFDAQDGPVGGGSHGPRGAVTELTGIGVLPAHRRRGIGAALSAALVADAVQRSITTVCCSAQDDEVARVYEGVGFVRVGSSGAAEPAPEAPRGDGAAPEMPRGDGAAPEVPRGD